MYAPTLDGCGERTHQARAGITVASQAQEIAKFLELQDLANVVLVTTSSGGLVAARIAEFARDRVGHLVFADALVPQPSETSADIVIPSKSMVYDITEFTRAPSREDMDGRMFAALADGFARLRHGPLHAASRGHHRRTERTRRVLGARLVRHGHQLYSGCEPVGSAPAPNGGALRRAVYRTRRRAFPDVESPKGASGIIDGSLRACEI